MERKRHLGNDVGLIVFKEGDQPFNPTIINSHFNRMFDFIYYFYKNNFFFETPKNFLFHKNEI